MPSSLLVRGLLNTGQFILIMSFSHKKKVKLLLKMSKMKNVENEKFLLQVPKNNAPVTQNEENLLSLENELESIEKVGSE